MSPRAEQHVSSYTIIAGGAEIDPALADRIKEIRVADHLRLPDVCTVKASFPKATGIDNLPFSIGDALEVRLGAKEKLSPKPLFKGEIVTLEPEFGGGGCGLTVRAFDRAHRLHRTRKIRTFQNQTSSDIVGKIVREAGLKARCQASGGPYEFMQQDNETDWDFIWRLAERIGFEFVIEDETAHFRRPAGAGTVALEWPASLRSFRPRVTAVQQVNEVTVRAHDPKTKRVIAASAKTPNQIARIGVERDRVANAFPAKVHVAVQPVATQDQGTALAQALLDKLANGYIAADGVAPGNPEIKSGALVEVSGVGSRFSGTYRVSAATHVLRGGGSYETQFANSPAHTLLDAIGSGTSGDGFAAQLVLGVVTNTNDPDALGRVRVKYPALSDSEEGAWARIAWPSAGASRGLMMLPVVGEEVLIGFEHGDTTRPYVLGSLFNGRDKPGNELLQDRDGSFAVRSDTKIYTESKKQYTIKSGDKLVVEIAGNVEEAFKADWKNDTTGKAALKSAQAFSVEGQSVSIKGQTQVTIEATATLTLKCGASQIQLSPGGVKISGPIINLG